MSVEDPPTIDTTPDVFRPSRARALTAAAVAAAGFLFPQEVPLEWYPLNNPSSGLQYLEITCAADVRSTTELFLNTGQGINERDKISFPIGPSEMAFTYTFPLADTPLYELRLDPLADPGELRITNFRIINRREEEIVRFTKDSLVGLHDISTVKPTPEGWKLVTPAGGPIDAFATVQLNAPFAPEGMNHRNFLRCLLSTSYLSLMLWILLLAVFFTFRRPESWRTTLGSLGFLALLAVMFSFVGNRGLIRNSIRYARFTPPSVPPRLQLEMDVVSDRPSVAQLFWDAGRNINQEDSARVGYEGHQGMQTLTFPLPRTPIRLLRFDPRDGDGGLKIHRLRIVDGHRHTKAILPLDSLTGQQDVEPLEIKDEWLSVISKKTDGDPVLVFRPEQLELFNRLQAAGAPLR